MSVMLTHDEQVAAFEVQAAAQRHRRRRAHHLEVIDKAARLDILRYLTPREMSVIVGIYRTEPRMTLAELGRVLGVSRERVRQIQNQTMRQLERMTYHWSQQEIGLGVARCPFDAFDQAPYVLLWAGC